VAASADVIPARPAWHEGRFSRWLTTSDHKDVGALSIGTALAFFVLALIAELIMHAHTAARSTGPGHREVVTLHLAAAAFLVLVPLVNGLGTYVVPLQVGARRSALPRVMAFAYWLYALGGVTLTIAFFHAGTGRCGWACDAPLTSAAGRGHTGDLWLLALLMLAVAATISAFAVVATIRTQHADGMTASHRAPFTRAFGLYAVLLMVSALFAAVVATLLLLDRHGAPDFGATTTRHLSWSFGYPELAVLLIPAGAIVAEVWRTLSNERRAAQSPYAAGTLAIAAVGVVPIGVLGLIALPSDGSAVLAVAVDTALVAIVLSLFAGLLYWWPKLFGRLLDEQLAVETCFFVVIGLLVATVPLFVGSGRGDYTYPHFASWDTRAETSVVGLATFAFGVLLFLFNVLRAHALRLGPRAGNDPWRGDTLEWYMTSPPPRWNFARVPPVTSSTPLRDLRRNLEERGEL